MMIRLIALFCIVTFISGCASVDTNEIENLHSGKILKLGHAGLGFESFLNPFNPYPPNGKTALLKAMEYGADGVEVDLQMTKDSVLVLFHDLSLESTTNLEGCIPNKTWAEIESGQYELGVFFDLFQSDKIMRLDTMLSSFQKMGFSPVLHFDLRIFNNCNQEEPFNKEIATALIKVLDQYSIPKEKVLIISSSLDFAKHLQAIDSPYPISYEETDNFESGLEVVRELGISSLTIKPKLITAEQVAKAHKHNIEIVLFGGKSRGGTARLIELNPDVIQSNNVRALVDLLSN